MEDHEFSRELLGDWLQMEGYEVLATPDLNTVVAAVQKQPPHAVLLDVRLGADNGLTLASWMRQEPKLCHIPVIAVTAHAMLTERKHILQAGCNAHISKPVELSVASRTLAALAGRSGVDGTTRLRGLFGKMRNKAFSAMS